MRAHISTGSIICFGFVVTGLALVATSAVVDSKTMVGVGTIMAIGGIGGAIFVVPGKKDNVISIDSSPHFRGISPHRPQRTRPPISTSDQPDGAA